MRPGLLLAIFLVAPLGARGDLLIPAPGRVVDLDGARPGSVAPREDAPSHLLVKLAMPLDAAVLADLRLGGVSLSSILSRDSAVLYGSPSAVARSPVVAWFSELVPEDKAPPAFFFGSGARPRVSVLGHRGSTVAELSTAARAEGLRVSGGYESPFGARLEIEGGAAKDAWTRFLENDGVFAATPSSRPRLANDRSIGTIQSGVPLGPNPIFEHGLYGEGETIGILDTGLDVDSCFFSDPGATFPVNSYSPGTGYGTDVGGAHRKIAAYDFLYPCGAFSAPCDSPDNPADYDNQGHGTHVAGNAAGDNFSHFLQHDSGDGMAPGARLVVQDAGYAGKTHPCGDLPGVGCAPSGLEAIFEQAYAQGARLHSDSWADDPAGAAPANAGYSMTARDVDDFVFRHPDFLPFFVAGNDGAAGPMSIPSPGNGKNVVCVGSTRNTVTGSDDDLSDFSGVGPAADGRRKPDLVAPGVNVSASTDFSVLTDNCGTAPGAGTSYAAPTAAGAGALVREYFDRGFYPSGVAVPTAAFVPSAALVKAMLIASGESLPGQRLGLPVFPAPSDEQGFGRINLSRVLAFPESPFHLLVADRSSAFVAGETGFATFPLTVRSGSSPLRVTLVWTDPPGIPRAADDPTPELVDDLDLSVVPPGGSPPAGTVAGFDRVNNVEQVTIEHPVPGIYAIRIDPHFIAPGPAVGFALVATGDFDFDSGARLAVDYGSAALVGGNEVFVSDCEVRTASLRIVNGGTTGSSGAALQIESIDSTSQLLNPNPISIPPLPPAGSLEIEFQFRTSFDGTPLPCAGSVPFRVILSSGPDVMTGDIAFPAAPGPQGCGEARSLICAPSRIRPVPPPDANPLAPPH